MEQYGIQATEIYNLLNFVGNRKDSFTCEILLDCLDLERNDFELIGEEFASYYNSAEICELTDNYVMIKIELKDYEDLTITKINHS